MMRARFALTLLLALLWGGFVGSAFGAVPIPADLFTAVVPAKSDPQSLPLQRPEQVTFTPRSILYAALSADGMWLATVEKGVDRDELWLHPRRGGAALPRLLYRSRAGVSAPAFSPDGTQLVFVGNDHDVKGDLYLLALKGEGNEPRRLSDRDGADGGPVFSADGRSILFHRSLPGNEARSLWRYDLAEKTSSLLFKGQDAAFAAVAPQGGYCAFVSRRDDPAGDLWLLDLKQGSVRPLTHGGDNDLYPAWSRDGKTLYFTRLPAGDATADLRGGEIFRLRLDADGTPYPLTAASRGVLQPLPAAERLYLLTSAGGVGQLFELPLDGEIPQQPTLTAQWGVAQKFLALTPPDPALARVACARVIERATGDDAEGGEAALALGMLLEEAGDAAAARQVYRQQQTRFAAVEPSATLAALRLSALESRQLLPLAVQQRRRDALLQQGREALQALATRHLEPVVAATAQLLEARLLLDYGSGATPLRQAQEMLETLETASDNPAELRAEAAFVRAGALARLETASGLVPLYAAVIEGHGASERWAEAAVTALLDDALAGLGGAARFEERVAILSEIAAAYRESLPRLAMGAWNRIGDLNYAADEWGRAKDAYRTVLDAFAPLATPTAAARFALAEILYRQERFSEALALYSHEMALRSADDRLYRLAYAAYLRKSLAAAERLYRLGEVAAARNLFLGLLRQDERIVPAHRGYIKAVAAQRQIEPLLVAYRARLATSPNDPVFLYATGLALTYRDSKAALQEAKSLITAAMARDGSVSYYPQTLGYIEEVLETVHGESGGLERAQQAYRRAAYLNAGGDDRDNDAHLQLNLGNTALLLGQYGRALTHYRLRQQSGVPFDNPDTELLFWQRLGMAAFQSGENGEAAGAYDTALTLAGARLEPLLPSTLFGNLSKTLAERLFRPAAEVETTRAAAATAMELQAPLNEELAHLSGTPLPPPPDPTWDQYRQGVTALLEKQRAQFLRYAELLPEAWAKEGAVPELLARRVEDALRQVPQLVERSAELHDRLGLALLEEEKWEGARRHFDASYDLNQRLGKRENLARNRRSAAYAAFRDGEGLSGTVRQSLMAQARRGFVEVLALLKESAAQPKAPKSKGEGLLSIRADVALDGVGGTAAAFGFSPEQERRLAETFIARIDSERGDLASARQLLERQLASYAKDDDLDDGDLFGVALLLHRLAHLDQAQGNYARAFARVARAARLGVRQGNPVSVALNVLNAGEALRRTPLMAADLATFRDLVGTMLQLLRERRDRLPALFYPQSLNRLAVLHRALFAGDRIVGALAADEALGWWLEALPLLEATSTERDVLALRAGILINLADSAGAQQLDGWRQTWAQKALETAQRGELPRYRWRAEALLGDFEAALATLAALPLSEWGCVPGEIAARFAPYIETLNDDDPEEAFNRLEELVTLSQQQRLTRLWLGPLSGPDGAVLRTLTPHLEALATLAADQTMDADYRTLRLKQEGSLLARLRGDDDAALPEAIRQVAPAQREALLLALGRALDWEAAAALVVAEKELPEALTRAQQGWEAARQALAKQLDPERPGPAGLLTLASVEAYDLGELLAGEEPVYRLLPLAGERFLLFSVSDMGAEGEILAANELPDLRAAKVLCADPALVQRLGLRQVIPSAAELLRNRGNRKPFRDQLLSLASNAPPLPESYRLLSAAGETLPAALDEAQSLIWGGAVGPFTAPPAAAGAVATPRLTWRFIGGSLPVGAAAERLAEVGLVALPQNDLAAALELAPFLSLCGVPTLWVGEEAALTAFLNQFAEKSAAEAVVATGGGVLIGDDGLDRAAAAQLGQERFVVYGRAGVQAYNAGEAKQGLILFENALRIAEATPSLALYRENLQQYARESAYAASESEKAIVHARALVKLITARAPYSPAHADALHRLGLLLANEERYGEAVPILTESVELLAELDLPEKEVDTLADFGVVLENSVDYASAIDRFDAAALLSDEIGDEERLAVQYRNLGRIYDLRLSEYARASDYYHRAEELYDAIGESELVAQTLLEQGRCARLLGALGRAGDLYAAALELLPQEALRLRMQIVLEQGNNAWYQGRYQEAFDLQRQVRETAQQEGWELEQVLVGNSGGLLWWSLGNGERAQLELEETLAMARQLAVRRDEVATTLNNLGLVQRDRGNLDAAVTTLNHALTIDRELGSRWAIAYDLRNLAQTRLLQQAPQEALPLLLEARELSQAIGNRINECKILLALGETYAALNESDLAEEVFRQALTISEALLLRESSWRARYGLSGLALARGEVATAKEELYRALETIEGLRAAIRLDQLKEGFLADKMSVYSRLVALLAAQGEAAEAFDVAERSRSRNLIDLLGRQKLTLADSRADGLYARQQQLKEQIGEQEAFLAQATEDESRELYRQGLRRLQADYQDLLLQIEALYPEMSSLVRVDPLHLAEVQQLLEPGVALLSYYQLDDAMLIWLVSRDGVSLKRSALPAKILEGRMATYRRLLQNLEPAETLAQQLYADLIAPVAAELTSLKALGIIPHAALHYLSFATLFDGERYLIEQLPLFYLPSASVLRTTLARRQSEKNSRVLAIGNPDLGSRALDLPFAEREARTLRWNYPEVTLLTRERATESWVRRNISRFGIIHLASHGEFDPVNPLFSAVKLTGDADADGSLDAEEIFGLDLSADLVVLSACQTGLGKISAGDDVVGMNRAFLFAGTHALISSLWRVSDVSTAMLMKQFYRSYTLQEKGVSLRKAMLHVKNRYPHPGYWGAFTLIGDYL